MCDASLYLGFHLSKITGVCVRVLRSVAPAFDKQRKLCMTTGCVCICCLLLVCLGDVKERARVAARVQQVRSTASTNQFRTDTS